MGDAYQIKDQKALYFLTFQVVGWIDIFTRQIYRDIVVDSFNFSRKNKQLKIHAWVIMSNHVHCILSSGKLSDTIGELKGFTSKEMLRVVETSTESRKDWMLHQFKYFASTHSRNDKYQLWTHENHAEELTPYQRDTTTHFGVACNLERSVHASLDNFVASGLRVACTKSSWHTITIQS